MSARLVARGGTRILSRKEMDSLTADKVAAWKRRRNGEGIGRRALAILLLIVALAVVALSRGGDERVWEGGFPPPEETSR
jgi:hypothetical protein